MNQCKLKSIKTRGEYLWNLLKVFSKTTPVAPQSQLPSQLCQVSSCGLILFFISFLSHSYPHLISLILRKLLEDNEDLRVIFLIRYSDIVAEHGQFCMTSGNGNDELSNIKLMSNNDQKKKSENDVRDPRGTVTHDGQPRGKHQLQIDSFCSNLLDDLLKVDAFTKT